MNHKSLFTRMILLTLALILSACTAPKTAPDAAALAATTEPLSCPTAEPLSCPTTAAAEPMMPEMNAWRRGFIEEYTNVVITFDPGDKCSMEYIQPVGPEGGLTYELVVNDNTYQNYMVVTVSLKDGKTYEDLKKYHELGPESWTQPAPFSDLGTMDIAEPMSRTWHGLVLTKENYPLYFICFVEGPGGQRVINEFQGITLPGN